MHFFASLVPYYFALFSHALFGAIHVSSDTWRDLNFTRRLHVHVACMYQSAVSIIQLRARHLLSRSYSSKLAAKPLEIL